MNLIDIIDYLEEENARLIARALESLDQVDEQQQWLDEINVLLGDHTNTQEERLARLRGVLEKNEQLRADVLYEQERNRNNVHAYQDHIDVALAKAEPSLRSREGWGVVREMVEALKGKP